MENRFDEWVILELMGHRRLAGKVTDATIGGGAFLRIDMPMKCGKTSTQFYSPGSIYCITPTTEEIAREVSLASQPEPVNKWEFPQLAEKTHQFVPVDSFPEEDDDLGDEPGGSNFDRDEN